MLIVKRVKKNEDGSFDVSWQLSEDQMGFLLTFAINSLVSEGLLQVEERDNEAQQQLDFLDSVTVGSKQ